MGMFVHADHDGEGYYARQKAMETLGIAGADLPEPTQKPRTNQDALIEKMRDVREMAEERIYHGDFMFHGDFVGEVIIFSDKIGQTKNFDKAHDDALAREIKWLLSPAEDGK